MKDSDKKNETALAPRPENAGTLTTGGLMDVMLADAGAGTNYDAGDLATPFLTILQTNSPQVKEESEKYVPGARPGMVLMTVTNQLFDVRTLPNAPSKSTASAVTLPVIFADRCRKMMVEWVDRDYGGGFVAQHPVDSPAARAARPDPKHRSRLELPNGNWLIETDYHWPLVCVDPSSPQAAVMSLSSTQLKKSRALNSFIHDFRLESPKGKFTPPIYALVFTLRTEVEKKNDQTWWGWKIEFLGTIDKAFSGVAGVTDEIVAALYDAARKQHTLVADGMSRLVPPAEQADAETTTTDAPPF